MRGASSVEVSELQYRAGTRHDQFGRPGSDQHQVSAARWIASRKLPNRRRIVFSDGRIAASVQLSAVGSEPRSATNSRRAATDSSIRVSATSDNGTASPSNTPGGFVLWELRSTTTTSGIHQARAGAYELGAYFGNARCRVPDLDRGSRDHAAQSQHPTGR